MATLIKIDKNGSKHFSGMVKCDRCGGDGMYKWGAMINGRPQYAGVCFKCDGAGKVMSTWIERTPEYQAKLDAMREKRQAKKQAEYEAKQAEIEAKREAERLEKERIEAERKAISQYVGEVGKRITVEIVEHRTVTFESHFGWQSITMAIHIMKDASGNVFTWKTQNGLGWDVRVDARNHPDPNGDYYMWHGIEKDEHFFITGTVKEHSDYQGEKQTVLTRCKIKEGGAR